LKNKGHKYYQNTHGTVFRTKKNSKLRKKMALRKKMRNVIAAPAAPKIPATTE
jgi:hypothetical protein